MIGWIVVGFLVFGLIDHFICEYLYKDKCVSCNSRTENKNPNSEPVCPECAKKIAAEENKKNKAR